MPSAAHRFVASCQSFGAKLDRDLMIVLQSVVYLIGLVFCCGGLTYVVVQKNSGKSVWSAVPTLDPATLDPKSSVQMKKLAVTPDTTYSGSA